MSRKRSKWKFNPPRRRRPAEPPVPGQDLLEAVSEEIIAEKETAEETSAGTMAAEAVTAEAMTVEAGVLTPAEDPDETADAAAVPEEATAEVSEEGGDAAAVPEEATVEVSEEGGDAAAVPEEATVEFPEEETAEAPEDSAAAAEISAAEMLPEYFFDDEDEYLSDGAGSEESAGIRADSGMSMAAEYEEEDSLDDYDAEDRPASGDGGNGQDGYSEDEPDEYDEDDFFEEEPPLSLYERGSGRKKGKKKKSGGKNKKGKGKEDAGAAVRIGGLLIGNGIPKICVSITGRNKEEIAAQAKEIIAAKPDLVEWRVDYLEEAGGKRDIVDILVTLQRILNGTPLLFTYRTEGEGGRGRVGWSHYAELLEWAACRPEIDLIDVEAMGLDVDTEGLIRIIHGRGTPIIASVHYCGEMPGKKERKEAIRFLKQSGGDILKIAVTPQCEEDVLDLMVWTRKQSRKLGQPLITMAMGEIGKVSRVSGRLTGSAVTFGSVGRASAPGQIPAEELRDILRQV